METIRKKAAIGYIRVSTEGQADDGKYGVDAQRAGILEYADRNGYIIVAWFQDEISGAKDDRPELDKILFGEEVTNPPFEAVIAFKSDRVARDTKLYFYYLYVLEKRNIKLISTQEEFPEGDFANIYRALMMFVAEQERKNIALRTSKGRSLKAAAGGYAGGRPPYGYDVHDGCLTVNEKEAKVVRLIFEMKGKPYIQIADWLCDHGYRTRSGGRFYPNSVKQILDNEPKYRGLTRYGGEGEGKRKGKAAPWIQGVHEAILTE